MPAGRSETALDSLLQNETPRSRSRSPGAAAQPHSRNRPKAPDRRTVVLCIEEKKMAARAGMYGSVGGTTGLREETYEDSGEGLDEGRRRRRRRRS